VQAYDIFLSDTPAPPEAQGGQGWCFGLPPGIRAEQWPLDPNSGYPLMHGFTLLLPEDYRVHGPDIVALSFFATAPDHNDGGPEIADPGVQDMIEAPPQTPPADPALLPFWQRARAAHPRLHRMEDILGCAYAVILLTQAEYEGAACPPPPAVDSPLLVQVPAPQWLEAGAWAAHDRMNSAADRDHPPAGVHLHQAFQWVPRASDPNAGLPPRETYGDEPAEGGYQPYYYWLDGKIAAENWREHEWAMGHEILHIGGTMRPVQNIPEFSPFYIEFEESFGDYNFGGGNGQLDFKDMKFDWACG